MKQMIVIMLCFLSIVGRAQTKVAMFGGSVAQLFQMRGGQSLLESMTNIKIDNFAKEGDGLCRQTAVVNGKIEIGGIAKKVAEQCKPESPVYDVYIIWCSTNDIWGNEIGTSSDYTNDDNYDTNKLLTQNGGLNYCIKSIMDHAPMSRILILGSMKSFKSSYGYTKTGVRLYKPKRRMWDYVMGQIECANRFSIPVLNLWSESGINEYNYKFLCPDGIHPTAEGYKMLCSIMKNFIQKHLIK